MSVNCFYLYLKNTEQLTLCKALYSCYIWMFLTEAVNICREVAALQPEFSPQATYVLYGCRDGTRIECIIEGSSSYKDQNIYKKFSVIPS